MTPTKMEFSIRYDDDSGVKYAIRVDTVNKEIEFEQIDTLIFNLADLDWIIQCLTKIKLEINK